MQIKQPSIPSKPSGTYMEHYNDLQQAIIAADFEYRKAEMQLNDLPLFSKNAIDSVRERWMVYCGLWFVAGLIVSYILCHL